MTPHDQAECVGQVICSRITTSSEGVAVTVAEAGGQPAGGSGSSLSHCAIFARRHNLHILQPVTVCNTE
eukprot:7739996-Pyramimonas_sp.AAC.1